jgi:2',3'-cyclic-nucleotide 2'-phosphodiesterase (5'-nucleotidase family)
MNIYYSIFQYICFIFLNDTCYEYDVSPVNISNYEFPKPENESSSEYTIAIFGTNDIHGAVFPITITHLKTKENYLYGGLEYLAGYINILKGDWKERFLWLDAGDQFQGAIESKISNGTIMMDFYNNMHVNASAIGNHEFDWGTEFLVNKLKSADFGYLASNIFQKSTADYSFLPNTKHTKMFKVGDINLGVIGLTTIETNFTSTGDFTDIGFAEYRDIIIKLSKGLREAGAKAVILLSHVGTGCRIDVSAKYELMIRTKETKQITCEVESKTFELNKLIESLDEGVIDAVLGGHMHEIVHHFIKGVPVSISINGGYYSHVTYLTFDRKTKKLIRDKIKLEGPLPSCEKIFNTTKRCSFIPEDEASNSDTLAQYTFHNKAVVKEEILSPIFYKYWDSIKQYKEVIGLTEIEMTKAIFKETSVGNMLADCLRKLSNADFAVINIGIIRTNWYPGNIMIESVWNMFPFENRIHKVDVTGEELIKMFEILQKGLKALYQVSNLTMDISLSPHWRMIDGSLKTFDGNLIELKKTYTLATSNFLLNGGDDFKDIVSWYTPRNEVDFGLIRDNMIKFVKSVGSIKQDTFYDPKRRRLNVID